MAICIWAACTTTASGNSSYRDRVSTSDSRLLRQLLARLSISGAILYLAERTLHVPHRRAIRDRPKLPRRRRVGLDARQSGARPADVLRTRRGMPRVGSRRPRVHRSLHQPRCGTVGARSTRACWRRSSVRWRVARACSYENETHARTGPRVVRGDSVSASWCASRARGARPRCIACAWRARSPGGRSC